MMWNQIKAMAEFARSELEENRESVVDFWTQYQDSADIHVCEDEESAWYQINACAYPLNADGSTDTTGALVQLF